MAKALIAGNWKMHGLSAQAEALALAVRAGAAAVADRAELVLCPPATVLAQVARLLEGSPVAAGGQDCHAKAEGAHTGDISAAMLADAGARFVILGHSERRAGHGETDAMVREKVSAAIAAGLRPIVCVGETLPEREAGQAEAIVSAQLAASLPDAFGEAGGVVAYEPVWAIGTGRTPSEGDIAAMHARVRNALGERFGRSGWQLPVLYGGSVKPANAAAILALPEVGGALVGGASLIAADFLAIAAAAPPPRGGGAGRPETV